MEYVCDVSLWAGLLQEHGYELLGQLDSGSFSDVFAVRSVSSNRVLAVKRMVARREISRDPRILNEVSCLKQLRDVAGACVIRLEGSIWSLDRLACLVLELAPLGDLERHAADNWPLSPKLVAGAVRQLLSALTHCHRLRIAHRDVNPANVLLMSQRSVRLADFGLAVQCRDSATGRPVLCDDYLGRDAYLAPEALRRQPYHAVPADLWSMGALCVFMLTGKHPPSASTCPAVSMDGCPGGAKDCLSLPSPVGEHGRRCRSNDSEGSSCPSESDYEESLPRSSVPDCRSLRGSDGEELCSWDPSPYNVDEDVFKQPTGTDCALAHLISTLRLQNPSLRLPAEHALKLWKEISSWTPKRFGIS